MTSVAGCPSRALRSTLLEMVPGWMEGVVVMESLAMGWMGFRAGWALRLMEHAKLSLALNWVTMS
uniref:hypothetical protein n=1 Tax=Synechococcus sp. CS-1329 TaxID=2847975 RepID=UPI00223BC9E8|nr:hypothetical protein [Synechococcus sp. CS-1329]